MSNKSTTNTIKFNISFAWLGVLFLVLKLAGVIDWPWIWVTAPFWAGIAISFAALLLMGLIALIALLIAAITK